MPSRDWKLQAELVLEAIQKILHYVEPLTMEAFISDPMAIDAIALNILVMGESAGKIPSEIRERHPEVPWILLRGIRNRVAHHYHEVDLEILWDTVQRDLRPLIPSFTAILKYPDDFSPPKD